MSADKKPEIESSETMEVEIEILDDLEEEDDIDLDFAMFSFKESYDQPEVVRDAIHVAAKYFLNVQIHAMLDKTEKGMPTFCQNYPDVCPDVIKRDYFIITMFYSYVMDELAEYKMQIQAGVNEISEKNLAKLKKRADKTKQFFEYSLEKAIVPEELVGVVLEHCSGYFDNGFLPLAYAASIAKGYDPSNFSQEARDSLAFLLEKHYLSEELERLKYIKDEIDAPNDPVLLHLKEEDGPVSKEDKMMSSLRKAESKGLAKRIECLRRDLFLLEHEPEEIGYN